MTEIQPLRAWRYNQQMFDNIDALTAPLFDVVSDKQRQLLYKNPYNSIHLSVPQQPLSAERAALMLDKWKKEKIILQDRLPGLYVYYQYFRLPGSSKEFCRKGFICHIRVYDWHENVILRHENTIPKSVNDRTEILEKTELQVSPTHGLYTDPDMTLEKLMDEAITDPLYESEDYQGVRDVMAVIHDAKVIRHFITHIKNKKIILADGHHRYEASLSNMHHQKRSNPFHTGKEGYNFHLMYLTNTESDDLRILPTHRLVQGLPSFDQDAVLGALADDFTVTPIEDADTLPEIITGKQWAFGLILKDRAFKLRLKPASFANLKWPFPEVVKALDLTVMHYFIIEKALGIPGKQQRRSDHLNFNRSFSDCLKKVMNAEAQAAIITNEVTIDEVKRVCESGYTMPQKSTYFYPKVICGFLFSSIREEEFAQPVYYPFP
ncbi:MAG TPA: DUF1015 domain-containing protein [Ohtaekwangia sp.]|nr:DUF1015 domain-containing protein [Ohtaekwangia sp.]